MTKTERINQLLQLEKTMKENLFQAKLAADLGRYEQAYTITAYLKRDYQNMFTPPYIECSHEVEVSLSCLKYKCDSAAKEYLSKYNSTASVESKLKQDVSSLTEELRKIQFEVAQLKGLLNKPMASSSEVSAQPGFFQMPSR